MAGYDDKQLDNLISRTFKTIEKDTKPVSVRRAWARFEEKLPEKAPKRLNWQFVLTRVAAVVVGLAFLTGVYAYTHPHLGLIAKDEQVEQYDDGRALLRSASPRGVDTNNIAMDAQTFSDAAPANEREGHKVRVFSGEISAESNTVSDVSGTRAYGHVKELAAIGERLAGSPEEDEAASYIYKTMSGYGIDTTIQEFYAEADGEPIISRNVIGDKNNDSPGAVYLTAHYDSVGGPGAVDNASGVGVLLELARVYANTDCSADLVFIAFGAEEPGLLGSRDFVSNLKGNIREDVLAVVNIDTVGLGGRFEPGYIAESGKLKLTPFWLLQRAYNISREMGLEIEMYSGAVNGHHLGRKIYGYNNGQHKSDHISFLEKGIPAVSISFGPALYWDEGGPLHSDADTLDMVDEKNLKRAGEMAVALVEDITNEPEMSDGKQNLGDRYFIAEFKDKLYGLKYVTGIVLIVLAVFVILAVVFILVRMQKRAA
ncbi:MAG TPA: M28 family peptidase [Anaerovoracaceae bacterium]|nr:M28 family peptidase [Anaerovoracaceae bacterium]